MSTPPSTAEWQNSNRSFAAALVNQDVNVVAAKRMLAVGRARELIATYDSPIGLLYMRRGVRVGVCDLQEAAIVAMALRSVGRNAEAEALLRESDVCCLSRECGAGLNKTLRRCQCTLKGENHETLYRLPSVSIRQP